MATYTNISTFTAGQVLTSSVMNDVKNNLDLSNAQSASWCRNLIYNGAQQIHQRVAAATGVTGITTSGYYTADRWQTGLTTLGTWTQSVENDAPANTAFRKSLKMLCTTAKASPSAGDRAYVNQALEGYDVQRIAKGTTAAQALTLTFWVKSNVTGTYVASLYDNNNNRHCSRSYTISASGTWEQKSITFPADTTGVFTNDNNASLVASFYLAVGSNYSSGSLATSWASYTAANDAVGQANVASATSNYWQVTGIQLEAGSVSTPFEFLPYGVDLTRCQRYFQKSYDSATAPGTNTTVGATSFSSATQSGGLILHTVKFGTYMRAAPSTVTYYLATGAAGTWNYARSGASGTCTPSTNFAGESGFRLQTDNLGASWAAAEVYGHWTASAEL